MILLASSNDYANLIHSWGNSLRSIGVDCIDVTLSKHPFNYPSESTLVTRNTFQTLSEDADHVLIGHSCPTLFDLNRCRNFSVAHTGTRFRESPEYFKELFQSAKVHLTDQTEFMIHKGFNYVVSGIDKSIYKRKPIGSKLIIGHFPSNPEVKGTNEIVEFLKPHKDKFEIRIGLKQVGYLEQLKRMSECDIIVELFKPELNGRQYGCFGVTALEASMMGKLVLTQDLEEKTYRGTYGPHTFGLFKTRHQFDSILSVALSFFNESKSEEIHKTTVERHSYEATGQRLKQLLGI